MKTGRKERNYWNEARNERIVDKPGKEGNDLKENWKERI